MMRKFLHESKLVLRATRKPGKDEYLSVAKITGLGILLLGLVGFLIMLIAFALGAPMPV